MNRDTQEHPLLIYFEKLDCLQCRRYTTSVHNMLAAQNIDEEEGGNNDRTKLAKVNCDLQSKHACTAFGLTMHDDR